MKLSLGKTNRRQVCSMLKLIYRNPGINRKQLGEALCIDRAMVTHIYNYFVENNWVIEQESAMKRLPLVLNYNRIYVAGVEIQPEYQVVIISNMKGDIVFEQVFNEKITDIPQFVLQTLFPLLENSGYEISGIGLAVPGIIISDENKIYRSVPFGLKEEILLPKEVVLNGNPVPVFLDNDVRCFGWGRVAFNKEYEPFFVFIQHFLDDPENPEKFCRITGGSSFFLNSKPCTGSHGCGGELPGQFRINDYREMHVPEEKRNLMKADRESMEKFLRNMAMAVAYFSNTFDVGRAYIAGFENMDVDFLRAKIDEYVSEYRFYPEIQNLDVVFCKSDLRQTALGACGFALEELIVKPCDTESVDSLLFPKKEK